MDIASRPSTPVENPETADAAPPPKAPAVIRREDYRPPDWLVPEIALDFALDLDSTRVAATLEVRRNPLGSGTQTLRLEGDGVAPDIEVPFTLPYAAGADPQLEAALTTLTTLLNPPD